MKRQLTLLIILTLISVAIVQAETPTSTTLSEIDINKLVIEENAKTRADLKEYIDRKVVEYQKYTKQEVEANFQALDLQINKFIRKASIKIGVIFFSAILFGGTILLLINRQVNKKSIVKREMIDTRFQEKIYLLEEQMTVIKKNMGREDTNNPSISPPTPPIPTPSPQYSPPPTRKQRKAMRKEQERLAKENRKEQLREIKDQKRELKIAEKNVKRGI